MSCITLLRVRCAECWHQNPTIKMTVTGYTRIFLTQFAETSSINRPSDCMLHNDEIEWHLRESLLNRRKRVLRGQF